MSLTWNETVKLLKVVTAKDRRTVGQADIQFWLACATDAQVKHICGDDGGLARTHAYSKWINALNRFQDSCRQNGGTFAYSDPDFADPVDESFCSPPRLLAKSSYLEDTLCNYISVCPGVKVSCHYDCNEFPLQPQPASPQ